MINVRCVDSASKVEVEVDENVGVEGGVEVDVGEMKQVD